MSELLNRVEILSWPTHTDARGQLATAWRGEGALKEVYTLISHPGAVRGNHLHHTTTEWFTALSGGGTLELLDPGSGERMSLPLRAHGGRAQTLKVPAGLAHALVATGEEPLVVVAMMDHPHDPGDVRPCEVVSAGSPT